MKRIFLEGGEAGSIPSRAFWMIAEVAIGLSYALATILGIIGAQRYAAPNLPIPEDTIAGIFIGVAIWAALTGLSVHNPDRKHEHPINGRIALGWVLISFIACTTIPLLYILQGNGGRISISLNTFIQNCLLSAFSFGLGGVIIGITVILIHFFFWRLMAGLKWGVIMTCAIGFLLGLSAGWAAYGWTVFSAQALFSVFGFL